MRNTLKHKIAIITALTCAVALATFSSPCADPDPNQPIMTLRVGDVMGMPGDTILMPVYISNVIDTVSVVDFAIYADPSPTVRIVDIVDAEGSLIGPWDYVDHSSSFTVFAVADIDVPFTNDVILPGSEEQLLALLQVAITYDSDVLPWSMAVRADVYATSGFPFCVDRVDSSFCVCEFWVPPDETECMSWLSVPEGSHDTVFVTEGRKCFVPEGAFESIEGTLLIGGVCGDIDGSLDGLVTMGDLTLLIDHLFIGLEPLRWPSIGNVDGSADGLVTIGDLTKLIDHLFISLDDLACQ